MRKAQWNPVGVLVCMAALALVLTACGTAPERPSSGGSPGGAQELVKRGEYLVAALGCDDCHTAKKMGPQGPEPDFSRRLAGHVDEPGMPAPPKLPEGPWGVVTTMTLTAWSGPWGMTYATNLTPDRETGMGAWTEEMFLKMIRTGKHMSAGRPVLPPMPWRAYAHLADDDLKAIFAFLSSLPPIVNKVPAATIATAPSAPEGSAGGGK